MKIALSSMNLRIYSAAVIVFLLPFAFLSLARAQITLDGSLGASGALSGPNFLIPADLGQTRGGNLFHSFGKFNIFSGESATFTGPASIENIIGRVTGGQQSTIDGQLRSDIAGANLYLLNPAGVFFGPNAKLEVSGSFRASTADYLRFADGAKFYASMAGQSVLTSAPISAFGFLSNNPAGLSLQGNKLQTPQGQTLSLIGGNLEITNSLLNAPGGRIHLASVASPGEVTPGATDIGLDGVSQLGNIKISQSTLSTDGAALNADPAGSVMIRGGQIVFKNSAVNARGNPGGILSIEGGQLDLDKTFVNTGTRGSANHPGTAVDITVNGLLTMRNGAEIASSSLAGGRAGDIRIRAGSIVLGDDDPSTSPFASNGFYGDIGSRAFASGRGGNVEIVAENLTIKNGFFINTAAQNSGDAGNVTVRVDKLTILDGASISSNGFGFGRGGTVDIEVGDALISARNINSVPNCPCFTGVAAQAGFGSAGGAIRIQADSLRLLDGGRVSSALFSIGPGADINITAKQLIISGVVIQETANPSDVHASIDARLIGGFATGMGGNIRVIADSIEVTDGGFIASNLFDGAPGKAGDITIDAARINVSDRGLIAAGALFGSGQAGSISIHGGSLTITGLADSTDPFGSDFTGVSTATGVAGAGGGAIHLDLNNVKITDKGAISSVSLGPGDAGNINLQLSEDLNVSGGAVISSSAFGSGNGGIIDITAKSVSVVGVGKFNSLMDTGISGIASQTGVNGGNAGVVRINTGTLEVLDGAAITTETFGPGNGGNIEIKANTVLVSGVNAGLKQALISAGVDPRFASARIATSSNDALAPSIATGNAGDIVLTSHKLKVSDGGQIFAETNTPGTGGNIGLMANEIELRNGGTISSKSSGSGDAGNITISSNDFLSVNSSLTTEAETADGGNIEFKVRDVMELVDSKISAEVKSGVGSGGNITIDPNFIILNNSQITANAYGGPGGNITIVADVFLATPDSHVTASSALSTQGTVDIRAAKVDLNGPLAPLPENMLQATELMNQSCATRFAGGQVSTLAAGARGALPWEPGTLMPSPLYGLELRTAALPPNSFAAEHPELFARLSSLPKPAFSINGTCSK